MNGRFLRNSPHSPALRADTAIHLDTRPGGCERRDTQPKTHQPSGSAHRHPQRRTRILSRYVHRLPALLSSEAMTYARGMSRASKTSSWGLLLRAGSGVPSICRASTRFVADAAMG